MNSTRKTTFLRDGLDSGSIICDWHYDGLEILHQFGKKRLKLKASKFSGVIPTFVEGTGEELVEGTFLGTPPHPE